MEALNVHILSASLTEYPGQSTPLNERSEKSVVVMEDVRPAAISLKP